MIVGEVIELLDLLRSLIDSKTKLDNRFFSNFVHPAWECFGKVHEDYKTSFNEYSRIISSNDFQLHSLVERIKLDSIRTADLRSELFATIWELKSPGAHAYVMRIAYDNPLNKFVYAIDHYFSTIEIAYPDVGRSHWYEEWVAAADKIRLDKERRPVLHIWTYSNIARGVVTSYLIRTVGNIDESKRVIQSILMQLQLNYDRVSSEYRRLRRLLLT